MTTKKKSETEKPEESILFPEAKVAGIIVKPWTFGKLFDISVSLDKILDKAEQKGIVDKLEEGDFSYVLMARVFTLAGPEILDIISITTDKTVDEIKELDMEDGIEIAFTIFRQNKEKIKNVLSPLLTVRIEEEGAKN